MAGCFGHLWTSAYGEDSSGETGQLWAQSLAGIGPAKIQHGIDMATRQDKPHPPNLPQFRAWCLSDGAEAYEPTKEEIHTLADQNEMDDRAYFAGRNADWGDTHAGPVLFDIGACIYTRSRYLSDAEKSLRRRVK